MKNLAVLLAIFLVGCSIHEETIKDGEKISFNVGLTYGASDTKAVQEVDASLVKDVNLYVFNSAGELLHNLYFTRHNVQIEDFLCFSKERYTVYLLVNWGREQSIASLEELKGLKYIPDGVSKMEEEFPLMTGVREDVHLFDGALIGIELSKVYACVNVRCNMLELNSGVSLKVVKVSLKNVPEDTFLFGSNVAESVVEGEVCEGDGLRSIMGSGVKFYMLENLQGSVTGAKNNKDKAMMLPEHRRRLCSYVEMECNLVSAYHKGKMIYRFYLGSAHDNCNVARNTWQDIEVRFKGNASEEESSVSVDNTALQDRVQQVFVTPSFIFFAYIGLTYNCEVEIMPASAFDKRVKWTTTNRNVVTVDNNGVLTTKGSGECRVYAISLENQSKLGYVDVRVM